jgi:hypothetical protein
VSSVNDGDFGILTVAALENLWALMVKELWLEPRSAGNQPLSASQSTNRFGLPILFRPRSAP